MSQADLLNNISPENYMEGHSIDFLEVDPDVIILSIQNVLYKTDLVERILTFFNDEEVNVDNVVQTAPEGERCDYAFVVDKKDLRVAQLIAERVTASDPHYIATVSEDVTKMILSGIGMRTQFGVAAKFFEVLSKADIDIRMVTTSEIRIAVIIPDEQAKRAVAAVKEAFNL